MSRLIDRMFVKCLPCRQGLLLGENLFKKVHHRNVNIHYGRTLSEEEFEDYWKLHRKELLTTELHGVSKFDVKRILHRIPVIAADDVGLYYSLLSGDADFRDLVSSMAPPFDRFFVEFQGVPNEAGIYAWGVLVICEAGPDATGGTGIGREEIWQECRWVLQLTLFLERERGKPFGPVASCGVGLAEDGTWFNTEDGNVLSSIEMPHGLADGFPNMSSFLTHRVFQALLAISFMHCKNVELREAEPPRKRARKHRKEHGRDLVRYHVLNIDPLKKILKKYRTGEPNELRKALHICRGHFKTFTEDAPLFGRYTGTYWWGQHMKGSKEEGVVLKDYRVKAPSDFGTAYREADENPSDADREAPPKKDPDSAGRGLAAHNRTQNEIAEIVRGLEWVPRSAKPEEPNFDIAWKVKDGLFVCEVKSITPTNEERQLRMAVGQVIRYRQKLNAAGHEPVTAVIAAEREPEDPSWNELCLDEGIVLVWPDVAEARLREKVEEMSRVMNSELKTI